MEAAAHGLKTMLYAFAGLPNGVLGFGAVVIIVLYLVGKIR